MIVGHKGLVAKSADGSAWTLGSSGITTNLDSVAWSGARLVAVGSQGVVLTSTDAMTWQSVESGVTESLGSVSWARNRFVAAGSSATLIASADGVSWSEPPLPEKTYGSFDGAAQSANLLVVVGEKGRILALP